MALTPASERFLRYWSANMGIAWESGSTSWPGFNYTEAERARMVQLTDPLPGSALMTFMGVTVAGFIVFAGIAVVTIMLPAVMLLYPDPSKLEVLPFVLIMASVIAVCLGIGLPLLIMTGGWAGDQWGGGVPAVAQPGDDALYAKVRWQFIRITIVVIGIFIPLSLLFILFQVDVGPAAGWLKLALGVLSVLALGGIWRGNRI